MSVSSATLDYEQAGELKIGQVGIATLRIRTMNIPQLIEEMRERVERAPKLFKHAGIILDFGGLAQIPDLSTTQHVVYGLREVGVLPIALAYGSKETEALARQIGLPVLAKFRAHYERSQAAAPAPRQTAELRSPPASMNPGMIHTGAVRSGQQLYAKEADLTVINTISPGAEVIADGNIHIYGSLRGRALAGAQGNTSARIFCRNFHAELVAISGQYKVLDDVASELRGKSVQIWLERKQIKIATLD